MRLSLSEFHRLINPNDNVADEREDVQKKTFAKWINSQLLKVKDDAEIGILPRFASRHFSNRQVIARVS